MVAQDNIYTDADSCSTQSVCQVSIKMLFPVRCLRHPCSVTKLMRTTISRLAGSISKRPLDPRTAAAALLLPIP